METEKNNGHLRTYKSTKWPRYTGTHAHEWTTSGHSIDYKGRDQMFKKGRTQ